MPTHANTLMHEHLLTLKRAPNASVWLYSSEFGNRWTCKFASALEGVKLELEREGSDPGEVVNAVYNTYIDSIYSGGIVQLSPKMIEQTPPERPQAERFQPPSPIDDDIPF